MFSLVFYGSFAEDQQATHGAIGYSNSGNHTIEVSIGDGMIMVNRTIYNITKSKRK